MALTKRQRENLSRALFDIGKLAFAVLVLGVIVSGKPFNWWILSGGMIFSAICFAIATYLDK